MVSFFEAIPASRCRAFSVFLTFLSFDGSVNSSRCVSTPITFGKPCTCGQNTLSAGSTVPLGCAVHLQDVEELERFHLEAEIAIHKQQHEVCKLGRINLRTQRSQEVEWVSPVAQSANTRHVAELGPTLHQLDAALLARHNGDGSLDR